MLCEITIENMAVIEKATASFSGGFTVLTGETGAGKSILIDSINAILGNRTSRDIVRSGADKARIWASFSGIAPGVAAALEASGYEAGDELLLYRELTADGKSSCRINGAPATAAMLREVCGHLIAIHGQHDNQSLLNPTRHAAVLDAFARNEALLAEYRAAYEAYRAICREMEALDVDEAEKTRRIELLSYESEEIEAAALTACEEEELNAQRGTVLHAQRILEGMNAAYIALSGGDEDTGAATLLAAAAQGMEEAAQYAGELSVFASSLNEMYYGVSEMASDIQSRIADFEFDDSALDAVEARLDLIYKLKQKYGATVEAVIAYGEKAKEDLAGIVSSAQRLEALSRQREAAREALDALAETLSQSRLEAFERLNAEIARALDFLNMPGITMALRHGKAACGPNGRDDLEFFISTNPGEVPKALAKVASGGELARIMLALKSALADRDDTPTVIYDEIDTGISGLAAGRIGRLLRDTSKGRQVICVTHTAQIAAYADRHLLIEKSVEEGRTYTHIRELDAEARQAELARIISGEDVTGIALANAKEMLDSAAGIYG